MSEPHQKEHPPKVKEEPGDVVLWNHHKCNRCRYQTKSLVTMRNHLRRHDHPRAFICSECPPEKYKCKICHYSVNTLIEYNTHVKSAHSKAPNSNACTENLITKYSCDACKFRTFSELVYLSHLQNCKVQTAIDFVTNSPSERNTKRSRGLFKCGQCNYKTREAPILKSHMVRMHTSFECNVCSLVCEGNISFREHVMIMHIAPDNFKSMECELCRSPMLNVTHENKRLSFCRCRQQQNCKIQKAVEFITKSPLETKSRRLYQSSQSFYDTKLKMALKRRKQKCQSGTFLICKMEGCNYKTKRRYILNRHHRTMHLNPEEVDWQQCTFCPFKSKHKSNLKQHVLNFHKQDDAVWFESGQCPYNTKLAAMLKRHFYVRPAEEDQKQWFECAHCPYKVARKCLLPGHIESKHMKLEAGDWFRCEHCSFKAKQKVNLDRHVVAIHVDPEDVEWFKCDKCSYKTKRKERLRTHWKDRHSKPEDIKWFQCTSCAYKAKRKAHLKQHVYNKHTPLKDIVWYDCRNCRFRAKLKFKLNYHMKTVHKD